jgi:transcriptional regulator with XRE-family HTH domain
MSNKKCKILLTGCDFLQYIENMGMAQKIRILMVKQDNITEAELARRLGQSPSNFNGKMKRDNFSEKELREIAEVLGCGLEINFIDSETGEKT